MGHSKVKKICVKTFLYLLIGSLAVIVAFPFVWMIFASFKDVKEFYVLKPTLLPEKFIFTNYTELIETLNIPRYYMNSIIVTAVQVLANVVIVLMAGYGFAKYSFKGKNFLFLRHPALHNDSVGGNDHSAVYSGK